MPDAPQGPELLESIPLLLTTTPSETNDMPPGNDTQTAIDILRAENERLTGVVSTLTSERDKHKADSTAASTERDKLKAEVGNPDEYRQRADKAEQALRVMTHKQEFAKVAKGAGAREEAIDDLFTLSGYNPTRDEIDPKAFHDLMAELKTTRAYAFADPAPTTTTTPTTPAQRPIPGEGRGPAHNPARSGITLTRAQLADPKFMLNPRNKEMIKSAAKEGRIVD